MEKQRLPFRKAASWRFLLPCAVAVLMLGVCTKSSPLYPMNDWVDVHCFFTVGRGIRHGMVPYLDLYEQKGPLIYFLYALAALVSEDSFLGVFIIEAVCFAFFLHYSGRIAEVLAGTRRLYPITVAVMGLIVPLTPAFSHGGSAEELMLPVLAGGLYIVVRAMAGERKLRPREGMLLGVLTAAAFWSKYTFCGLFVGLAIGVMIWYFVRKWAADLAALIGFFLLGLLIPSLPLILWFAARGGLSAMWEAYILNNLGLYSQNIRGGHYDPPLQNLLNNLPWSIPAVLGLVLTFFGKAEKAGDGEESDRTGEKGSYVMTGLTVCLAAVGLFAFTYMSGRRYPYYAVILSPFACLGYGCAFYWIRRASESRPYIMRYASLAVTVLLAAGGPFAAYRLSQNAYILGTAKEDMPQYRFAARIHETQDQTLLNYGFLDGGFYYAAGVLPSSPYFCTLNLDLEDMKESLSRSVREGKTAYVVTRQRELKEDEKYELIDTCSFPFEGRDWKYYLYRRRDLTP